MFFGARENKDQTPSQQFATWNDETKHQKLALENRRKTTERANVKQKWKGEKKYFLIIILALCVPATRSALYFTKYLIKLNIIYSQCNLCIRHGLLHKSATFTSESHVIVSEVCAVLENYSRLWAIEQVNEYVNLYTINTERIRPVLWRLPKRNEQSLRVYAQ